MGFYSNILVALIVCTTFNFSLIAEERSSHLLYVSRSADPGKALTLYRQDNKEKHDLRLLEEIAIGLLEQGVRSSDEEEKLLALYGAGLSADQRALPVLTEGLNDPSPLLQAVSLQLLSRYGGSETDRLLLNCMKSPYLILRGEAAFEMAKRKTSDACDHIETLQAKSPSEVAAVFPKLYAIMGSDKAKRKLRQLMNDPNPDVRIASILSSAEFGHDDLLPSIRRRLHHLDSKQQEAAAFAVGLFQDDESQKGLERLSKNPSPAVRLAAAVSLTRMGNPKGLDPLLKLANQGDLFAIRSLGSFEEHADRLVSLLNHPSSDIRLNAALSLLELQDDRCLPQVKGLLLSDPNDLVFCQKTSPAGTVTAWTVVSAGALPTAIRGAAQEISTGLKEQIILSATSFSEQNYLSLAHDLLSHQQQELIPAVIQTLDLFPQTSTTPILELHAQTPGAPLIRTYCALALYKLRKEPRTLSLLRSWAVDSSQTSLIEFRPLLPRNHSGVKVTDSLTPKEKARLLIDILETMTAEREDSSLEILLDLMEHGNQKNRYALAGLLLRATQ